MNICIPVTENRGTDSPVCAHFGSAPIFMIVNSETGAMKAIANANEHHAHGMCQPLKWLAGEDLDALVVGGIGRGAMMKLAAGGIDVYLSRLGSVGETLDALKKGQLAKASLDAACGGHGGGGGCGSD